MAINNFIPTVWSETLYTELDREYVGVANCSREFEGDIKGQGDCVKIAGIGPVSVFDYSKNTDMSSPETLSESVRTLEISRAKAFNFQIDDIDRAQQTPKLMSAAMKNAAAALSSEADKFVFSLYTDATEENTVNASGATFENIVDFVLEAREKLAQNDVLSANDTVLEVSPAVASLLLKAKLLTATSNEEALGAGYIGSFIGFDVYTSNNVAVVDGVHKCFARTKRAIAFAEQLSEIEAYRPEARFADAVKGLHLYGAKVVYPGELVLLNVTVA